MVDTAEEASEYEVINGVAYPRRLEDTKQYSRQMELYGGKGLVLVDALQRWFAGLWHGKPLAVIIAVFSGGLALTLFHLANHPGSFWSQEDPDHDKDDTDQ
jgi:hypothetical protein